jgi:hypothetical protein
LENPAVSQTTTSLVSVIGAPELSNPTRCALTVVPEDTPRVSGIDPSARMIDLRERDICFFPPQPPSGLSAHELHTRRLMVRSVSWLTLRSLFATAATSRRANAQMRREFDEMADRFQEELDKVHAKLAGAPRLAWALAGDR